MTDMVFPSLSLFGSTPEDFDCLTVIIILTMVLISGTLRFVQESRSGSAAEKLLAMARERAEGRDDMTAVVLRMQGR